ncbi:MAG: acyl-CoA dehydrogenase family protein [Rubrivivax sp.]
MIDFSIPEDTRLLLDSLRRFVDTEVVPLEAETEATDSITPRVTTLRRRAQELGYFAMGMPADVGGGGLNCVESCLVEEQIGRTSATLVHLVFGRLSRLLLLCEGEQRERYLLPTVRGEKNYCFAITEPGAGSDAAGIRTRAARASGGYVLNGTKHFITFGDTADYAIVTARTGDVNSRDIGLFLVDKGTPGFSVVRRQQMMGHRGTGHAELNFADCFVPESHVLGDPRKGLQAVLEHGLSHARLVTVGGRSVAQATRLLEMARDYAKQRTQFGAPIGNFQLVQAMLADMVSDILAVRLLMLNTAWELDQGIDVRGKVAIVKVQASEMLGRVADRAMQIFGGAGYTTDLPIERIYRDCRVMRIWDGASEVMRLQIAKAVLAGGLMP